MSLRRAALAAIPIHVLGALRFPHLRPQLLVRGGHSPKASRAPLETSVSDITAFDEACQLIKQHYLRRDTFSVPSWNEIVGYNASVRALVESLGDQYSRFLPVEAMQSFLMHLEGESYGRGIDIDQISARDPGRLFPHLKFEHLLKAAIATSMRSISFDLYRMTLLAWFTAAIFLAAISFFGVSKLVYVGVVPLLLLPVLTLLNVSMFVITGINGGSMNKFDASNETTPFGLEIGDIILSVNGSAVSRCDPSSLRRILDGGESGEAIDISVLRLKDAASWGIGKFFKTINISVIKRIAYDPSVNSFKNKNGVTVLQIRRFQESTPQEVVEALGMNDSPSRSWIDRLTCIENIKSNNTAVVIDLRGNTGGDLFAAIDSASLFLPFGRVISHIYSKPLSNEGEGQPMLRWARYFHFWLSSVRNYNMMTDLKSPLLVLVDNHTASAAEILAWALHDHGRACTWGEKTYGKSIAQAVLTLCDGSGLVISSREFRSPLKKDMSKGLTPDFEFSGLLLDVTNIAYSASKRFYLN